MPYRKISLLTSLMLLTLVGCSGLPGKRLPTLIPEDKLPTVIEQTAQALIEGNLVTLPPSSTPDPNAVKPSPLPSQTAPASLTPSISTTPTLNFTIEPAEPLKLPDPLPQAEIQIISPGRLSRVLSPVHLHLYLVPGRNDRGEDQIYQISLYGAGGELIKQENITRKAEDSPSSHLLLDLDFSINKEAESARLEISAVDPYGRVSAISTTDIILLSTGEPEIKTILELNADMIIQQPISSTLIQGGMLTVRGLTRIAPGDELQVECLNRDGGQIGSAILEVDQKDLGQGYRAFEGEIPYQVGSSSWVRVQVIAQDGQFSGIQSLSSVEVLVSP